MIQGNLVKTITKDGLELAGFWIPQKKTDIAVFHSHGTAGDFYTHKFIEVEAKVLVQKGISFLTANNRGHDVYADIRTHNKKEVGWKVVGGGFERFEDCMFDIMAWLDFLSLQGIKKVILQGHSLSQKILFYQNLSHDKRVIGQIHISPQNDAGIMLKILGKKKYKQISIEVQNLIKQGKGDEPLPKEYSPVSYQTSAMMYSGYMTENGPGTLTPYHNSNNPNWKVISEVKEPLLVVFGSKDPYMEPNVKVATKVIKEKTKNTPDTTVMIINGAEHSYIGYERELVKEIIMWLSKTYKI